MITLTPIVWVVRAGSEHAKYGDDFEGIAVVQRCGNVAHVSAAKGPLSLADQAELAKTLRSMGFSKIVYERARNGELRCRQRNLLQRQEA